LDICKEIKQDEINRRLQKIFPSYHLHFKGKNIEEAIEERDRGIGELRKCFTNKEEVQGQIQKINKEVEDMISDKTALLKFSGKTILGKYHHNRISGKGIGMSFEVFCYLIAEKINKNGRTPEPVKNTLSLIQKKIRNSMKA